MQFFLIACLCSYQSCQTQAHVLLVIDWCWNYNRNLTGWYIFVPQYCHTLSKFLNQAPWKKALIKSLQAATEQQQQYECYIYWMASLNWGVIGVNHVHAAHHHWQWLSMSRPGSVNACDCVSSMCILWFSTSTTECVCITKSTKKKKYVDWC